MRADETSVTRHTTRLRLKRLELMFGGQLDEVLKYCKHDQQRARYLDALCLTWFGPILPKYPRSDRGNWHELPDRVWSLTCEHCGGAFHSSRFDARFCRNACRQAAYRQREAGR